MRDFMRLKRLDGSACINVAQNRALLSRFVAAIIPVFYSADFPVMLSTLCSMSSIPTKHSAIHAKADAYPAEKDNLSSQLMSMMDETARELLEDMSVRFPHILAGIRAAGLGLTHSAAGCDTGNLLPPSGHGTSPGGGQPCQVF